jgi:hypothetical protein
MEDYLAPYYLLSFLSAIRPDSSDHLLAKYLEVYLVLVHELRLYIDKTFKIETPFTVVEEVS